MTMSEDVWADLLNSDWHDHLGSGRREDRLENPVWLRRFLSGHRLDASGIAAERLVPALRALRGLIRRMADACAVRRAPAREDWGALNAYLDRAPLVRRLTPPQRGLGPKISFVPRAGRLEAILGDIAHAFGAALADGEPSRVKVCGNADCLWVFYDRSRNKSRRWCEATCGNLMKVRRFRERTRREVRS
jgi:predicted RNA-binding Zn ribbon-like protein